MPIVIGKESEHVDSMIRRFKRSCEKENVLSDVRKHEFRMKPKWKRRQMHLSACKRHMKKLAKEREVMDRGKH